VTSHFFRSPLGWFFGLVCCSGCSLAVDPNRKQCSADADCTTRGSEFAESMCVDSLCVPRGGSAKNDASSHPQEGGSGGSPAAEGGTGGAPMSGADAMASDSGGPVRGTDFGCMDKPRVVTSAPGPFHVTMHATTIVPSAPAAGLTAVLCSKLDVDCMMPTSDPAMTDSNGDVAFDIPRGFTGYVQFTRSDTTPGLYFFNPGVDRDLENVSVQIATPGIVDALTKSLGSPQDPKKGVILMSVFDCNAAAAPNIVYVAEGSSAVPFYATGGLPNATAMTTDTSGYGGFVNVPSGVITVKGLIDGGKRDITPITIIARAGSLSITKLVPIGR
jgi:hypothetical protein